MGDPPKKFTKYSTIDLNKLLERNREKIDYGPKAIFWSCIHFLALHIQIQ